MSTRIIVALFVTAIIAGLVLLAANSLPASTIPIPKATSDVQDVQTKPTKVQTEVLSLNLSTPVPSPSLETPLPDAPSILQNHCTQCHQLQKVQQAKKTRSEWEKTLSEMESFNVKISDKEKTVLLDYLAIDHKP